MDKKRNRSSKTPLKSEGRYALRGVSAHKEEVHRAIGVLSKGLGERLFCRVVSDVLGGEKDTHASIIHSDGAGTKSALAYIYWKETQDTSVWRTLAQDALVMNSDDLLCMGVSSPLLVSSNIARNKHVIPAEVIEEIIGATESLLAQWREWGIEAVYGGGETADVGDIVQTLLVDTTIASRAATHPLIDAARIQKKDVIVGLASFGQTHYESEYNSGIGSNGLTAARHELLHKEYAKKYPESYAHALSEKNLAYNGTFRLLDPLPHTPLSIGKAMLSPTRTYIPLIQELIKRFGHKHIHGIIHCTGGGQTKVLRFARHIHIIKDQLFTPPPLFELLREKSAISTKEMYTIFNMGHRMEIYTDEKSAAAIIHLAAQFGIEAQIVGHVVENSNPKPSLTLLSPQQEPLTYTL